MSSPSPASSNLPRLNAYIPPTPIGGARGVGSGPASSSSRPSATIARPANGKLKLTVKAPPSKLRQATSGSQIGSSIPPNPYADGPSESDATPQPPASRAPRSTRNPRTVVEPESDEMDEDEDAEGEVEDDDEAAEEEGDEDMDETAEDNLDQELLANEDSEEDAEGEEDEDMDDAHPPPPIIKQHPPPATGKPGKPNVTVTAPSEGPLKSVEAKEMSLNSDDELSSLDEGDDTMNAMDDDEDDRILNGMDDDDDDDDNNTDEDDLDGSRSATPDLSKLTRRQRGHFEEEASVGLMALSNEALKKKHLTAEEHAMRRAEMARRRPNLNAKRNEEEKMDTIHKLLSKPAPKRRTRAEMLAAQMAADASGTEDGEEVKPDGLFVRYVNAREGSRVGVPEEWLGAGAVGAWMDRRTGAGGGGGGGGRMVEEVA